MSRQIVLDTETTGLSPAKGHRIIEIGCVEIIHRRITDNHFHCYLNPERKVDEGALKVHGLSDNFLQDKPKFVDVHLRFLNFIQGAELIIHNAAFDVGFLDHELQLLARKLGAIKDYCAIIDTLELARQLHPGQKNNLDALCKRYDIDITERELHGALLDAKLLARLYLTMTTSQESFFGDQGIMGNEEEKPALQVVERINKQGKIRYANKEEQAEHQRYVDFLVKKSGVNLWGGVLRHVGLKLR